MISGPSQTPRVPSHRMWARARFPSQEIRSRNRSESRVQPPMISGRYSYGTIIVDLERNRPIDLLPDRHAETVAGWLKAHPGVEVVARDRAGAYADGIRAGAPNAVQVSDRWHLLRNLGDALAGVLDRHHHDLRAASKAAAGAALEIGTAAAPSPTTAPLPAPAAELPTADRHGVRQVRFDEVMALHGQGWPMKRIARTLGINRKTVRAWVRSGELPVWSQRDRGSAVDRHAVHLRQRWGEGCHNAAGMVARSGGGKASARASAPAGTILRAFVPTCSTSICSQSSRRSTRYSAPSSSRTAPTS